MTLSVTVGGTEVATTGLLVVPESGLVDLSSCADGSSGDSLLRVEDLDESMTFQQWDKVIAQEDACSQPRSFTGYVYQWKVIRHPGGKGRIWELSVIDLNALLEWRKFTASDADRPAETGSDRLTWLLGARGMSGLVYDNGEIMANAWNYDPADYRDQSPYDVLGSIVDAASAGQWLFFVYWDPSATSGQEVSLFYGQATTTTFNSTMSISNVPSDLGTLCVPPWDDADLTQVGADIYDGVDVIGPFGRLYRQLGSTYTTFGVHRDFVHNTIRNNNFTSASAHADQFLANHAAGVDTITCTVRLPRSQVNLIDAGMRIAVKFSHLPGYESFVYTRVARRTFTFAPGTNLYYDVKLTLTVRGINQSGGGGNPGDFPHPPGQPPAVLQEKGSNNGTLIFDATPSDGSELFAFVVLRAGDLLHPTLDISTVPSGFTLVSGTHVHNTLDDGHYTHAAVYHKTASSETNIYVWDAGSIIFMREMEAGTAVDSAAGASSQDRTAVDFGGPVTTAGAALVTGFGDLGTFWAITTTPTAPAVEHYNNFYASPPDAPTLYLEDIPVTAASPVTPHATATTSGDTMWAGVTLALKSVADSNPPFPGQWVYGELVTLTAGAGTTQFPFADGSLHVRYDIIDQTPAIVSYDGATGDFTMPSQPPLGTQVFVDYQGL